MTKGALRFFAGSFCHIAALGAPAAYLFFIHASVYFYFARSICAGFFVKT